MAVLIPRQFARLRQIEVGTVIDLESVQVVQRPRRRYKLSELMTQYKPEHRQGEWELGGPVGNETW
jgi:antitoxin component of MazEF toxin-antitoxin module